MKRWQILSAYLVRLAGFAFDRLEALRCPRAAVAEAALAEAVAARLSAGRALDEALEEMRYADDPVSGKLVARAEPLPRDIKHARRLARAFAVQLSDAPPPVEALREVVRAAPRAAARAVELDRAHARWQEATRAFEAAFVDDLEQARGAIRRLYEDDRLREAVFLQSPEAFVGIQQLMATEGARNSKARERERRAAVYAQRFCAKNDTNSICGPVGIAYLTAEDDPAGIEIVAEDAKRETYFSHWAAQRLLEETVRRAGHAARVTLRLNPAARVEDAGVAWCAIDHSGTTYGRRYARSALPPAGVRLLRALAQPRTHAELAQLAGELELDADELDQFVEQLVAAGIVLRGPMLPGGLFRPLRAVAAELARWQPSDARAWGLAEVAAFEELVAAFARAPLDGRRALYTRLVARFVEATGGTGNRGEGRHYADRSVLHEDCYVGIRAGLGPVRAWLDDALPALISALELPLELARERVREWFRARFGADVRVPVLEVHRAFDDDRVLETPASTPRAVALRTAIDRVRDAIARATTASGDGPARLSAQELRLALAGVAPPSHPGYVSADVMLRRLPSGVLEPVLAEVHGMFWIPTCLLDVLPPEQCERVVDQMRAAVRDLAHGRRTAECVFLHATAADRRFPLATTDLQMITPSDRPDALDLGALDLQLVGDELAFLHGDEEVVPLVAFTRYPFVLCTSRIAPMYDDFTETFFPESLLPGALRGQDAPRLSVDNLVVRRRVWQRPASYLRTALAADSDAELFQRAQVLRRELGCEAHVFVSLAGEPKPVLLDFQNQFLLEALVSMLVGRSDDALVKISEMLPGPDELVARGPDGLRTSELRMGFYRV